MEDILFDLYYKQAHRNEELEQTIEELQNDLKQAHNEIILLNKQRDMMQRNINILCKENIMLRHELNEVKNNDNNY